MRKKLIFFLPLFLILLLCGLLFGGLKQDPHQIAAALIGKPVPEFYQADLLQPEKTLTNKDLPKQAFLLNVWGSWCYYCQQEHPLLMQLQQQGIQIVGINYRDKPQGALAMLAKLGNPFRLVIADGRGELALKLGVDGAPETYLVDKNGIIRYRYSGAIDQSIWLRELQPEWEKWNK